MNKMRTTYTKNHIEIYGNTCIMFLYTRNQIIKGICYFDLKHLKRIKKYKWCMNNSYIFTTIKGKLVGIHRVITNCPKGFVVDHIDRNPLNNVDMNLRVVTQKVNMQNNASSGVSKSGNRWRAYICVNAKQIHLGCFKTKEEATEYRKKHKIKIGLIPS